MNEDIFSHITSLIRKLSYENVHFADLNDAIENDKLSDKQKNQKIKEKEIQIHKISIIKQQLYNVLNEVFVTEGNNDSRSSGNQTTDNEYIPNYNTLSTVIDRISIENVKLFHFEQILLDESISPDMRKEFEMKIRVQNRIIRELEKEISSLLRKLLFSKSYRYIKEERTFI